MATPRAPKLRNRASAYENLLSAGQSRTMREAKEQETIILEKLKRSGCKPPPYRLQNYIGKGTYGRVYLAQDKRPNGHGRVAIKIQDVDTQDFKSGLTDRDQSLTDFVKEMLTLRQLEALGAENVNLIYEVLEVGSQLWIISEYCPGGSVHTLMQATGNKVEEKFIVPIARELAKGLASIHKALVLHRDIKAANVMIHEEGRVQIIDFGVATILERKDDKRMSVIGTPHWMGPEALAPTEEGYGTEVDTWSYGCTIFEFATGFPPRKGLLAAQLVRSNRLGSPPKLKVEDGFSQELCDFVAFILVPERDRRPSMEDILNHKFLRNTDISYPTGSLRGFVRQFQEWASAGGQRQSLIAPYGAEAATLADNIISNPEWRFSTMESTEMLEKLQQDIDQGGSSELTDTDGNKHTSPYLDRIADMTSTKAQEDTFNSYDASELSSPYLPVINDHLTTPQAIASTAAIADENQAARGGKQLDRIWDIRNSGYNYPNLNPDHSDLPLRNTAMEPSTSNGKSKELDTGASSSANSGNIALADASTLKAKRRPPTMDLGWKFPAEDSAPPPQPETQLTSHQNLQGWTPNYEEEYGSPSDDFDDGGYNAGPLTATQRSHDSGIGLEDQGIQSSRHTLDLDALLGEDNGYASSTAYSVPEPTLTQQAAPDVNATIRDAVQTAPYSSHGANYHPAPLSAGQRANDTPYYVPSAAAMAPDADPEVLEAELMRLLEASFNQLDSMREVFGAYARGEITDRDLEGGEDEEYGHDGGDRQDGVHGGDGSA